LRKQVIIVAGGQGKRMHSEVPKQFLIIAGKPLLMHTIERFYNFSCYIKTILVLPEPYFDLWKSLCTKYDFRIKHKLCTGGDTRFLSVKNGLELIDHPGIIAIHDGVRPFVNNDTLSRTFSYAETTGNAVPSFTIYESMRKLEDGKNIPVNREQFRLIQTPQCFLSDLILKAYEQEYSETFTDDATVVEAIGVKINLVEGNPENIKITCSDDLRIAESLLIEKHKK